MPAIVELQNDAGTPVTSWNFGAVDGSDFTQTRFRAKNIGSDTATSVSLIIQRLVQNDGIDFVEIAPDSSGNPGVYQTAPLSVGTMAPDDEYYFWLRVSVPNGTTPRGNPRQFQTRVVYTGT